MGWMVASWLVVEVEFLVLESLLWWSLDLGMGGMVWWFLVVFLWIVWMVGVVEWMVGGFGGSLALVVFWFLVAGMVEILVVEGAWIRLVELWRFGGGGVENGCGVLEFWFESLGLVLLLGMEVVDWMWCELYLDGAWWSDLDFLEYWWFGLSCSGAFGLEWILDLGICGMLVGVWFLEDELYGWCGVFGFVGFGVVGVDLWCGRVWMDSWSGTWIFLGLWSWSSGVLVVELVWWAVDGGVWCGAGFALVSCDGLGGYDWSDQAEEGPNFALMAYSSSSSDSEFYLPTQENFMPPTPDLSFTGLDEFVNELVVENSKAMSSEEEPKVVRKNDDAPIIEE
ncbi:hypothetical protein Tco_1058414 [Tanacetum coccineum]|uniref:Uncharacterized protein n=1 Tax=Tanacetum coccineum TaxID=301880 RepID=A0ABQ5H9Z6_9ASTR